MNQRVTIFGGKLSRVVLIVALMGVLASLIGCGTQGTSQSSANSAPVQVVSSYNVTYADGDATSVTFDLGDHGEILKGTTTQTVDGVETTSTKTLTYTPDGVEQTLAQDSPDTKFSCDIASTVTGTSTQDQTVTYEYGNFDDKGSKYMPVAGNSTLQYSPTSLLLYKSTGVFRVEEGADEITVTSSCTYEDNRINHFSHTEGQGDATETLTTIDYVYGDNDTATITFNNGENGFTTDAVLTYEDGYLTKIVATLDGEPHLTATFEYRAIENPYDLVRKEALINAFTYFNNALAV